MAHFQKTLSIFQKRLDQALRHRLEERESRLQQAIDYSLKSGGKRVRPFLVMSIADAFQVPQEQSNQVALAIEYIHTYSLIHDDLPAMDNSPV